MKTKMIIMALLLSATTLSAQNYEWAKGFGGSDIDEGHSIAVDGFGNVYTTGQFQGTMDFDPGVGATILTSAGSADIFVQKMDSSGNFLWARSFGGNAGDGGRSISIDASGNVYTAGSFAGTADFDPGLGTANLSSAGQFDIFVQKMDSSGNFLWAKGFGGFSTDVGYSIGVDGSGNVYTSGEFGSTVDFDPGPGTTNITETGESSIFVQKMDASGNFLWAKALSGDQCYSSSVDASGNVYTTGQFQGTMDFDPGVGTTILTAVGLSDIFVQKLDASGNFLWAKAFGGVSSDGAKSISVDTSGSVYVTGFFLGTVDFDPGTETTDLTATGLKDIFVEKLDSLGNFLWAKAFGGTGDDNGNSVTVDASGNVYTAGSFVGTADFDPGAGTVNFTAAGGSVNSDIFVQKMDGSGNFLWAKAFGGTNHDRGLSICVDSLGNLYTTGIFKGTADFDPGVGTANLTVAGISDIFVQKMSAAAEVDGYVFVDADGNGTKDPGELPVPIESIIYGNGNDVANTDSSGFFRAFPPTGANTFNYVAPPYHTSTTPVSQSINVQLNVIDTLYFGLQPIPNVNDLEVQIHPYTFPRPGFTRNCQLSYQNVGTTTLNDVVLKFLKATEDDFVSASGTYTVSNDTLIWNLGTLQPFSSGNQTVTHTLSISAMVGDSILTQAWIKPILNDSTPEDNVVSLNELIIGSYDPNDKTVSPETSEPTVNAPLAYTIRFQNTGNYQADFVVITDTLDALLDISTFQMVAASHPYHVEIINRVATWTFAQINLPDSITDEPGSHGFVKFSMKRVPGLGVGTQIPNNSAIYFDYNPPIITNTCVFTIEVLVGVDADGNSRGIVVYPNPTSGNIQIDLGPVSREVVISAYNMLGALLQTEVRNSNGPIDYEMPKPKGIYMIRLVDPDGKTANFKVVKE